MKKLYKINKTRKFFKILYFKGWNGTYKKNSDLYKKDKKLEKLKNENVKFLKK